MSLTLLNLLKISVLKGAVLLSGEDQLEREVKWINIMEILDAYEELQRGEFLISTGYGLQDFSFYQLKNMMAKFVEKDLTAIALQPGYYFDTIPEPLILLAREHNFPLIQLPTKITWAKITKGVYNELLRERFFADENVQLVHEFLIHVLMDKNLLNYPYQKEALRLGINLNNHHCIALMDVDTESISGSELHMYYKNLLKKIQEAFVEPFKLFTTSFNNQLLLLLETSKGDQRVYKEMERLFLNEITPQLKPIPIRMSAGNFYSDIHKWRESYQEALFVMTLMRKGEREENFLSYHHLGLTGILMDCRKERLIHFAEEYLGRLLAYDEKKGTHLYRTLYVHVRHLNQTKTAQSLHLHRLTLRYRLQRIEDIIEQDLSHPQTLYHLYLCTQILDLYPPGIS